ncbi:MAG: DUF255 domain-containing protein [Holophagaceae bacterium]
MVRWLMLALLLLAGRSGSAQSGVAWRPWGPAAFAEGRTTGRLVLVDAEATWCHWCHVMEARTYSDPAVVALLGAKVVAVKADIDRHPDARELYEDIGWPGTAIYAPDGTLLYRHRGYLEPAAFLAVLRGLLADQARGAFTPWGETPQAPAVATPEGPALERALRQLAGTFDADRGGWGVTQKYPIAANVEASLLAGEAGRDPAMRLRALYTLVRQRAITDPVWGGLYQYSVGPTWHDVHFERLATLQAGYLENLALATRATGDGDWVEDARRTLAFATRFLEAPEGGFAASMDADLGGYETDRPYLDGHAYFALDDAGRVKAGIPRVDRRRYAQVQGLMISALASLHAAAPELDTLAAARRAEAYAERALAEGDGYRHEAETPGAAFLSDQAAMLKGLLALHEATGERPFLARAERLGAFITGRFATASGLYRARAAEPGAFGALAEVRTPFDDNAALARGLLRLHAFTGDPAWRDRALGILRVLDGPGAVDGQGRWVGEFAAACLEASGEPAHLTVVGAAEDPRTQALFQAALATFAANRVVVRHDPAWGPPRHPDLGFPPVKAPAAFLCGKGSCSRPLTEAASLVEDLAALEARRGR